MIRNVFYAFATLALLSCCAIARRSLYVAPTDLQTENIKGAVKTIRHRDMEVFRTNESDPNRKKSYDAYFVLEYNRAGNMTSRETYYGTDSIPNNIASFDYDDAGINTISSEVYYPATNQYKAHKYVFDIGRLSKESDISESRNTSFIYDDKGYPIAEFTASTRGWYETRYDSTLYRYNWCGRRIEEQHNGESLAKYSYNRDGTLRREYRKGRHTIYHNPDGNVTRRIDKVSIYSGDHDSKKYITKIETTLDYELDERGNWTRRTQTSGGEVVRVSVREIEYYD